MSTQEQYPTHLTDSQWEVIEPVPIKIPAGPGRAMSDLRCVINGILYVTKSGCQWQMMAKSFGRGKYHLWVF